MPTPHDLGRIIRDLPFFSGMPEPLLDLLTGCARNERFEPGDLLLREGHEAERFYVLREGAVNVEVKAPAKPARVVETVPTGGVLGWSWMVPPYRYAFSARAVGPVRALSFDAPCLRRKMEAAPELGYDVLRRFVPVMAERIASARLQILDLYG